MYEYKDYFETYGRIMQFNKNKSEPFHRWYPFVEGYSKEFIQSIIFELDNRPEVCLEPFSGSGTTALELQDMGIKCMSFEVNPLMYLIAKVKLENEYDINVIQQYFNFNYFTRLQGFYKYRQTERWSPRLRRQADNSATLSFHFYYIRTGGRFCVLLGFKLIISLKGWV